MTVIMFPTVTKLEKVQVVASFWFLYNFVSFQRKIAPKASICRSRLMEGGIHKQNQTADDEGSN